jgi:hypothetical protein
VLPSIGIGNDRRNAMSTFLAEWKATTQQIEGAAGQATFALDRLADVVGQIDAEREPNGADYVAEILTMTARIEEIRDRLTS